MGIRRHFPTPPPGDDPVSYLEMGAPFPRDDPVSYLEMGRHFPTPPREMTPPRIWRWGLFPRDDPVSYLEMGAPFPTPPQNFGFVLFYTPHRELFPACLLAFPYTELFSDLLSYRYLHFNTPNSMGMLLSY